LGGYASGSPIINIQPIPPDPSPGTGTLQSVFSEVTNVAVNSTETILSFTATSLNYLTQIDVGGENIATYDILINGVQFARLRTYWGDFTSELKLATGLVSEGAIDGYKLNIGDTVLVNVTNFRPSPATFECRLQYTE